MKSQMQKKKKNAPDTIIIIHELLFFGYTFQ